ncbi:MAG: PsiF family protein [Betaproteobacteria bacterium]
MKTSSLLLVAALVASTSALAADPAPNTKPATAKASEISKPAAAPATGAGAKTDPRSASGPVKVAAVGSQQNRMKECNKSATGKKGPERKAFMKSCLSTRKS